MSSAAGFTYLENRLDKPALDVSFLGWLVQICAETDFFFMLTLLLILVSIFNSTETSFEHALTLSQAL